MTIKKMDWSAGKWLNKPQSAQKEGDFYKVKPEKGREYWIKT